MANGPLTNALQNYLMGKQARQQQTDRQRQIQSREMLGQMLQTGQAPEGFAQLNPEAYMMGSQEIARQRAAESQASQSALIQQLRQEYAQTQDPAVLRQLVAVDPEAAGQIRNTMGAMDEEQSQSLINQATAFAQVVRNQPDQAMEYFNENLADVPAFQDLADELAAGDYEDVLNGIGVGITALGGQEAYDAFTGAQQDPTAFMQEMIAAGIEPGSEEYKGAVLERYGKGQTIGFDVVEAVNPSTGNTEYYQVSRVDPGNKIPLGVEVPTDPRVQAAQAKQEAAQEQQMREEMIQVDSMLENVDQIINSPGLDSWSGIQALAPVIPGTEQANTDALIERLQSQQFLKNIQQMRGMGALSNAEGQKVAAAAAALKRSMTDEAVKRELNRIREELLKARERIQSGNLLSVDDINTEDMPNVNAAEGRTQADRRANAASDAGVVNWSDL